MVLFSKKICNFVANKLCKYNANNITKEPSRCYPEEEIRHKNLKNGRRPSDEELRRWYDVDREEAWLTSGDGVKFVVSTEMTKYSADIVKSIAEEDGWVILTQSEN